MIIIDRLFEIYRQQNYIWLEASYVNDVMICYYWCIKSLEVFYLLLFTAYKYMRV